MADAREDARAQYAKTRTEFEKLETQDKTAFVVEATFQTIGQAIEETGRHLADAFESVFDFGMGTWAEPGSWRHGADRDAPGAETPNPAAPPSSAKRAKPKRRTSDASEEEDE